MITSRKNLIVGVSLMCALVSCKTIDDSDNLTLWYEQPADEWMKALPLGNGRLSAMVYGGTPDEKIALNEITFWTGTYDADQDPIGGAEHLNEMRRLFFDGKYAELHDLASRYMTGRAAKFGSHVPVGDMNLHFAHSSAISDYRRVLDIEQAISTVTYKVNDTLFNREMFCSHPANVMVMKLTSNKKAAIDFDLSFSFNKETNIKVEGNKIVFDGYSDSQVNGKSGVEFAGIAQLELSGGTCAAAGEDLQIRGADEVILYYDLNTDYQTPNPADVTWNHIESAIRQPYQDLVAAHKRDYDRLFSRVSLSLGTDMMKQQPTDVRQKRLKEGGEDPALSALLMQYGRYLVIAGSREDSPLPLNLQGNWNDNLACTMSWNCDYHLDINTEQNYWNTNVCNLAECNKPLFNYIKSLVKPGRETVRKVYGTRGWTAHTTANCWGHTSPSGSIYWGAFPTGGTWLALHMVDYYKFTHDTSFMQNEAYPILKENARFLLDYLTEDPQTGYLLTGPSISPENGFGYNGGGYCLSMMPTVDRVLTYELFTSLIDVCRGLDIDKPFCDSLQYAVNKLPPFKIGSKGQLQEWYYDYDEINPNHRHTSHLLGLYPYYQISTPELEAACRVTIENRLNAEGWEDVEWSRANSICYYARLKDAEKANYCLRTLITDLSRENLFTVSPKGIAGAEWDIFAVDGNTAASAAVAEMLVQSHKGYVEWLPCLPTEWSEGSFSGLCVRGGAEVSASWRNSSLRTASLKAVASNTFRIKLPAGKENRVFLNGKQVDVTTDADGIIVVDMGKDDLLEIK